MDRGLEASLSTALLVFHKFGNVFLWPLACGGAINLSGQRRNPRESIDFCFRFLKPIIASSFRASSGTIRCSSEARQDGKVVGGSWPYGRRP